MLHELSQRQKILVMVAVMSGLFVAALDQTIVGTSLSRIVQEFNAFNELSWVVTAYLLTSTITVPISGKMSDLFGRKRVLLVGVILFGITSLLAGSSQNMTELILYRALQGIGGGILTSAAFTIVGDLFSPSERGKWQGLIGGVFGMASVVGPLLGGYFTDQHSLLWLTTSWRWDFWVNVPVAIFATFMIWRFCPNFKHPLKAKIDYLGAATLAVALAGIVLGAEDVGSIFKGLVDAGWSVAGLKTLFFSIAAVATGLFIWIETKAAAPIIPLRLFKSSIYRNVMIATLMMGAAFLGGILYLTQFLQQALGIGATQTGFALMPMIFSLAISSALCGRLVTKLGHYKKLLVAGMGVVTLGMFLLVTLNADSSYIEVAIRMVLLGAGLGVCMPLFNLAVQNDFDLKDLGVVTSSVQLSRGLGSTIGTAVLGSILTAGVAINLTDLNKDAYVQTLKQSPASSQIIHGDVDGSAALQLNNPDTIKQITSGFEAGIAKLPVAAQKQATQNFEKNQHAFSEKVKTAFADSLSRVFLISSFIALTGFIFTLFIKDVPLKHSNKTNIVISE
jgi:EmrB/QacA subfamily drug resistance transporter